MSEVVVPSGLLRVRQTVRSLGRPGDFLCCGFWNEELPADVEGVYTSYVAVWILRGRVRLRDWRGQVHRLGPGDLLQRVPGRWHASTVEPGPYGECWLEAGGAVAELIARTGLVDLERPLLRPGLDLRLLRRIDDYHRALTACPESELARRAVELQALIGELVALDRRHAGPDPRAALVDEACRLLRDERAPRAAIERLCKARGIGSERFRKLFAARMGCPPTTWRNRCRIDRARELLLTSDATVREIADRLGWASTPSFSLFFKAEVGVAPADYRARRRPT